MNSEFQFFPNIEPSGLAGRPRDTVCWLQLWLWQSRRHKLVPSSKLLAPTGLQTGPTHVDPSSSFHFEPICSSLTTLFCLACRELFLIELGLSTNLGSTLATARALDFYSRHGVGWNSGKLVKLPMEITQVTAWDFSLHSNYKGSPLILYGPHRGRVL